VNVFEEVPDRSLEELPTPIGMVLSKFAQETSACLKLSRLIDAYEVVVKLIAAIRVQNFYCGALPKEFPEIDSRIREHLSRPTGGHWLMILREASACLKKRPAVFFAPESEPLRLETVTDKLCLLRNHVHHGATLDEGRCIALFREHIAYLGTLLAEFRKLAGVKLAYVVSLNPDGSSIVKPLVGLRPDDPKPQTFTTSLPIGHVVAFHAATNQALDLYPFLIWDASRPPQQRCLFFMSVDRRAAEFLDYSTGDRKRIEAPDPLPEDFRTRFPRPSLQEVAQGPNGFSELIESSTQHFVGRSDELARLDRFAAGGPKRVLVVIGSPGLGKTALLAQWAKQEFSLRHFIREGDPATEEPAAIFENLGLQLAAAYQLKWMRPANRTPADHRAEFDRLLLLASKTASAPIVIQIDGLDEAERTMRAAKAGRDNRTITDWLPEASAIPMSVRWILSTRSKAVSQPNFMAKFGTDKAEHLYLRGLSDANVRELLLQVCSWQEVLVADRQIEEIVRRSQGHPLYLRMVIEDIAAGRLSLARIDALPSGVKDYFSRILDDVERESRQSETPETSHLLQDRIKLLTDLRDKGDISPERFSQRCKQAKEELQAKAECRSLELLAVFAAAQEPLLLSDAAAILGRSSSEIDRAFRVIRTVLDERQEDQYALFHSAFRAYFIKERSDLFAAAVQQITDWCSAFKDHRRPYAVRRYVGHLADAPHAASLPSGVELAEQRLEQVLTDFEFIQLKVAGSTVGNLLRDYDLAISAWPDSSPTTSEPRFDPTAIPNWLKECTAAIAADAPLPHSHLGSGPALDGLTTRLQAERVMPRSGLTCNVTVDHLIKRGEPARFAENEIPDTQFGSLPSSRPTIEAILRAEDGGNTHAFRPQGDERIQRVQEFQRFVQLYGDGFNLPQADILALAYNQAASGAVAEQASLACKARTGPWIRSEERPPSPLSQPLLLRTFLDANKSVITYDFRKVITGTLEGDLAILSILDASTGETLKRMTSRYDYEQHSRGIPARMFVSADCRITVFGNAVWDLQRGRIQTMIEDDIMNAAVSADGRLAITSKREKSFSLWDLLSGTLLRHFECEDEEVHQLAMSGDGRVVAIASHGELMRLYGTDTGRALATFHTSDHVCSVALTPDAKTVVFGGDDRCVRVLSVPELVLLREFKHDAQVTAVAVSWDGRVAVSCDRAGVMRVWDIQDGKMLRHIETHEVIPRIQLAADASLAFGACRLWDLKSGRKPFRLRSETDLATSLYLSANDQIMVGTSSGRGELWNARAQRIQLHRVCAAAQTTVEEHSPVKAVHLRNAKYALLALEDGSLKEWCLANGEIRDLIDQAALSELKRNEMQAVQKRLLDFKYGRMSHEDRAFLEATEGRNRPYYVARAAFSPDGSLLATAVDGESIRAWDVETGRCSAILPTHVRETINEGEVLALEFSRNGSQIVFVNTQSDLCIWRYSTRIPPVMCRVALSDHAQALTLSAKAPWALRLASQPPRLEWWDLDSGKLVRSAKPPGTWIQHAALGPDDRTLLCVLNNFEGLTHLAAFDTISLETRAVYPTGSRVTALSKISESGRFVCATEAGDLHVLALQNF
jgi:WD40 repeat protein